MQNSKLATLFGSLLLASMLTACGSGGESAAPVASANETVTAAPVGGGYQTPAVESAASQASTLFMPPSPLSAGAVMW